MKNKRLALKLLAKDCQIAAFYVEGKQTCAVGCLALASGASKEMFTGTSLNNCMIGELELAAVRQLIKAKFGLTSNQLELIQETNDRCTTTADRREAVLKVVRAIN